MINDDWWLISFLPLLFLIFDCWQRKAWYWSFYARDVAGTEKQQGPLECRAYWWLALTTKRRSMLCTYNWQYTPAWWWERWWLWVLYDPFDWYLMCDGTLTNFNFLCGIMFYYVICKKGNNLGIFDTVIEYIVFLWKT